LIFFIFYYTFREFIHNPLYITQNIFPSIIKLTLKGSRGRKKKLNIYTSGEKRKSEK